MTEHPHIKSELHGADKTMWFYLYECGHLTKQTYPPDSFAGVVPIGEHANLLLCKHCWTHIKSMALSEMLQELIRHEPEVAVKLREIVNGQSGSG